MAQEKRPTIHPVMLFTFLKFIAIYFLVDSIFLKRAGKNKEMEVETMRFLFVLTEPQASPSISLSHREGAVLQTINQHVTFQFTLKIFTLHKTKMKIISAYKKHRLCYAVPPLGAEWALFLFKINPYGLIKQPTLCILADAVFRKALQSE